MLNPGDGFPRFVLPDENGETFDSSFLSGIRYILFVFDCSDSAIPEEFNSAYQKLMIRNVPVIGVSANSVQENRAFMEEYGLKMKFLSDVERKFLMDIGSWEGRLVSSTFLVGKDGRVEGCWYGYGPGGHVGEVYDKVKKS